MNHTLRGGNAVGFMRNGVLYSDYESGCFRRILMRDAGIEQGELDEKTKKVFALGHQNEKWFINDNLHGASYEEEKLVSEKILDDVDCQGHVDIVTPQYPYELKSVTSKNTHRTVFVKGEPKLENVIQLVNYMLMLEMDTGILVYTSYLDLIEYGDLDNLYMETVLNLAEKSTRETRRFIVKINSDGTIDIDHRSFNVTCKEILKFKLEAARCLSKQIVYLDRPASLTNSMFNACSSCKFRNICTEFEETRYDTETFLNKCRELK